MRAASRRKLSDLESRKIKKKLLEKWNFRFEHTHTFSETRQVLAVSKADATDLHYQQIIQIISLYTDDVIELSEDGKGMETPVMLFHPDGFETVYCDNTFSWMIYASSNGKLTFAGEWLTKFVESIFTSPSKKTSRSGSNRR